MTETGHGVNAGRTRSVFFSKPLSYTSLEGNLVVVGKPVYIGLLLLSLRRKTTVGFGRGLVDACRDISHVL